MSDQLKFEQNPHGTNEILTGDGFFISYQANPHPFGAMFSSDHGGSETALHVGGKYLILNGDHRAEYQEAATRGADACVAVYQSRRAAQRSSWSEDPTDEEALEMFFGMLRRVAAASEEA